MEKIPKIIHYCWFSGEEKPPLVQKCIKSWKKYLPDYEIIEWNTHNIDLKFNNFAYQAYKKRKWAFASDVVRLKVLYEYGGIYLDSDVEILKSLDNFLDYQIFTGFENENSIQAAIIGAKKNDYWVKKWLEFYDDKNFIKDDGSYEETPNPVYITAILKEGGLNFNNEYQILNPEIHIFPKEFFSPKDAGTRKINTTKNTVAIHHFSASWVTGPMKFLLPLSWVYKNIINLFKK